jgi:hypothetical protein
MSSLGLSSNINYSWLFRISKWKDIDKRVLKGIHREGSETTWNGLDYVGTKNFQLITVAIEMENFQIHRSYVFKLQIDFDERP